MLVTLATLLPTIKAIKDLFDRPAPAPAPGVKDPDEATVKRVLEGARPEIRKIVREVIQEMARDGELKRLIDTPAGSAPAPGQATPPPGASTGADGDLYKAVVALQSSIDEVRKSTQRIDSRTQHIEAFLEKRYGEAYTAVENQ